MILEERLREFNKAKESYRNVKTLAKKYNLGKSKVDDDFKKLIYDNLWNKLLMELTNHKNINGNLYDDVVKTLREHTEYLSEYEQAINELWILEVTEGYSYLKMCNTKKENWVKAYERYRKSKPGNS